MSNRLTISSSPHIKDVTTIEQIMLDVIIALIPASMGAVYFFGVNAFMIIAISIITAIVTEAAMQKIRKQRVTINDLSAIVTGLLLALTLPPSAPLWIPIVGSFIAVGVIKQLFGGIGHNFMNPALGARIFLSISYTDIMTSWTAPLTDSTASATPLVALMTREEAAEIGSDSLINATSGESFFNLFIGNISGSLGETSFLLLLIGGIYLIYKNVISIKTPAIFIGSVALFAFLYSGFEIDYVIYHILSGGLIMGAMYMATDYATTPMSNKGRAIFALGCGILTSVIRIFGGYPEGVGFSIILMNLAVPLIDKYTRPKVFGEVKS